MIKIICIITPIVLGIIYLVWAFLKASGKKNFENKMRTYKNLMPQQKIIIMHKKQKKIGTVIKRCNVPRGYVVNIGKVINITFPDFIDVVKK